MNQICKNNSGEPQCSIVKHRSLMSQKYTIYLVLIILIYSTIAYAMQEDIDSLPPAKETMLEIIARDISNAGINANRKAIDILDYIYNHNVLVYIGILLIYMCVIIYKKKKIIFKKNSSRCKQGTTFWKMLQNISIFLSSIWICLIILYLIYYSYNTNYFAQQYVIRNTLYLRPTGYYTLSLLIYLFIIYNNIIKNNNIIKITLYVFNTSFVLFIIKVLLYLKDYQNSRDIIYLKAFKITCIIILLIYSLLIIINTILKVINWKGKFAIK